MLGSNLENAGEIALDQNKDNRSSRLMEQALDLMAQATKGSSRETQHASLLPDNLSDFAPDESKQHALPVDRDKDLRGAQRRPDGSFEKHHYFYNGQEEHRIFRPDRTLDVKYVVHPDKSMLVTVYGPDGSKSADMLIDKQSHVRTLHEYNKDGQMVSESVYFENAGARKITYDPKTRERISTKDYDHQPEVTQLAPAMKRVANGFK